MLNASGAFTYALNETDPAVQALRLPTNTLTDVFSYTMRDAAGAPSSATLTVTIHGANDAPVLAIQTGSQTATVGSAFSLTLPAGTFTDVDSWRLAHLHRNCWRLNPSRVARVQCVEPHL